MKKTLIILSIFCLPAFGQKIQFDKACEIIKAIHQSKRIAVNDKITSGEFMLELYMFQLDLPSQFYEYKESNEKYKEIENIVFKKPIIFNPIESKYFSRRRLKKVDYNILISFVKFDGKTLRIDVSSGVFKNPSIFPNLSYYQYQFSFDKYYRIKQINWIERKE